MPDTVTIAVDGRPLMVRAGTSVAAAVVASGAKRFRTSITGQPRGPLCGIGTCFECRATIDGLEHCRSCQIECREGMNVVTT